MKEFQKCEKRYLLLPIAVESPLKDISIYADGQRVFNLMVPVSEDKGLYGFQYYAPILLDEYRGKNIRIEGADSTSFEDALSISDDLPKLSGQYPHIHFAANTGWLNDPNGMIYKDGVYHLCFQHNPFDTKWQNMSWGHAISTDLLHWQQLDNVLLPDGDGTMFSGSGIVNEHGMLGLPRDAMVFFYTCAGNLSTWSKDKKFTQKIAYSTDNGKTVVKKDGCILDHIVADNRDPKVYWHEQSQKYYMVLYLVDNDFAIFNSSDLENWEMTQRITLPNAWECPDLREVPIEGGGSKWMFWTADGYYFLGNFDGSHFEMEGGRHEAYCTMLPYAAQTFWGTDKVITIPWLRTANYNKPYTSVMGIPRQLSLVKDNGDYILRQRLVDEFENAKEKVFESQFGETDNITFIQNHNATVEVKVSTEKCNSFILDIYGTKLSYDGKNAILKIEGIAKCSESVEGALKMHDKENMKDCPSDCRIMKLDGRANEISFVSDAEIMEITVDGGLKSGMYETQSDAMCGNISIQTEGNGKVEISEVVTNVWHG
jgi:levanase/fructan beta-fructosidase